MLRAFAKNLVKSAEGIISQGQYDQGHSAVPTGPPEPSHGFRVIHVAQNSAASEAGLESLFDYIIGINGHELDNQTYDEPGDSRTSFSSHSRSGSSSAIDFVPPAAAPIDSFVQEIANCKGRSVTFTVWSAKGRVQRTVMLPVEDQSPPTLSDEGIESFAMGMTVQWTPLSAAEHVWHVLNVAPNSPADQAGLISHADYIVGAENGLLEAGGESLLGRIVSRMVNSYYNDPPQPPEGPPPEIELYVYNHDYDILRPVRLRPTPHWGGTGLLGFSVGYGLLHRLPAVAGKYDASTPHRRSGSIYRRDQTGSGSGGNALMPPGGTLYETDDHREDSVVATASGVPEEDTSTFITPADLVQAAPHINSSPPPTGDVPPPPASAGHKPRRKQHYGNLGANDLQDYFAEESKKSKELDASTTNLPLDPSLPPPPPKKKG
ncbi:hypothetical protein TRVA0_030S00232 [Trichomonascus vanleenenianus]|uniref:Grh1p n=1 Tax=Trichomonascus vanleenenianus TaxID=2268995 RepID=UPI003ECB2163